MATTKTTKKKAAVGLSSPWYIFAGTIQQIFEKDNSVEVVIPKSGDCEGVFEIFISSDDAVKLAAIKKLIGDSREFGNIKVVITYELEDSALTANDMVTAFKDTGYFDKIVTAALPVSEMTYVVMKKDVLQVYGDNTMDYYGNINTVVAQAIDDIIQDSVKTPAVAICTKADKDPE